MNPSYLQYLKKTNTSLKSSDGHPIAVWELDIPKDEACLSEWAGRFRQNYCLDSEIDAFRDGTGYSRRDYLLKLIFPDSDLKPGPSIRSGDFAEMLISDYVEYLLGYWVPREKYGQKESRNESAKGVDIVGYKQVTPKVASAADELITYEVKGQLSGAKCTKRLQVAIDDSAIDYVRASVSLNAAKQRFIRGKELDKAEVVKRFQNLTDNPYVFRCGAAAVLSGASYSEESIAAVVVAQHTNVANLELLVVRGNDLMTLAQAIYERAANEA